MKNVKMQKCKNLHFHENIFENTDFSGQARHSVSMAAAASFRSSTAEVAR